MNINTLFEEIEETLELSRKMYLKTILDEEYSSLRSLEEAFLVLSAYKEIILRAEEFIDQYSSLKSAFEKEYGQLSYLISRDLIIQVALKEDFLFPESESFPLISGQIVDGELLRNYVLSFQEWCQTLADNHNNTQKIILENFSLELKHSELLCHCVKCTADYRAKLRDHVYKEQVRLIDEAEERLHDLILTERLSYISDYVSKLKKHIDRNVGKYKYKLKRGSLNRLDSDIKAHFKRKFGFQSEIGQVYKERLYTFFNGILTEEGHAPDLITESEYTRFFTQINIGIWKSTSFLKREFLKLVRSILAFKRKDISATILRDYLGQFWIHSEARRKQRKIVYHMGPTNSGKTYNAIEALSKAQNGCYLAPLRLLASELFDTLNDKGCRTTLLTGEEVIETDGATHFSSTIEMARLNEEFECAVIDEIQMITDPQRGWAWTRALVNLNADEIHLCGDHSVFELVQQILKLTGDTLEVHQYERKTSLKVLDHTVRLVDLEKNDTLIVFSRRNALKYKRDLENLGFKVSIVYGRLSPEVRREQARKFDQGETDIMVATDAIAMGMNLPVKRIVFTAIAKFYDGKEFPLSNSEIKQIAGRAGRFKRFPEGHVTTLQKVDGGLEKVEEAIHHNLKQKELAMVGPDLDIFRSVNNALEENNLTTLKLSEFLQLFNTMSFEKPFYCVDLKEMIELAETVESSDLMNSLSDAEVFGFACAPVNQGLMEHVQYYVWILNHYVGNKLILNEPIDSKSDDIDYLETAIKCVELYQWLARHFDNKNFSFDQIDLLANKQEAIERLNELLSEKISKKCSSCGVKLDDETKFNICETCFSERRFRRGGPRGGSRGGGRGKFSKKSTGSKDSRFKKKRSRNEDKDSSKSRGKKTLFNRKKKPKSKADAFKKG